ncbi:MAG: hypothetical protein D6808_02960 [Candidatus Dadabacteria bacterium]|nr:MAG: hypothetical protein D6808_02960 [Candidatus Dadabacteria bacterium]
MNRLVYKITLLVFVFFMTVGAYASSGRVEVVVSSGGIKPIKAIGLLISSGGVISKGNAEFRKVKDGVFLVSIPVQKGDVGKDTVATALLLSEDGKASSFGEVVDASSVTGRMARFALPQCKTRKPKSAVEDENIYSNLGNLESLLEIRKVRRDFLKLQLKKAMSGSMLKKLRKIEEGFGLYTGRPLSPDLDPYELSERLFRIYSVIRTK